MSLQRLFFIIFLILQFASGNMVENIFKSFVIIHKNHTYHTSVEKLLGTKEVEPEDENLYHPVPGTVAGDELVVWDDDDDEKASSYLHKLVLQLEKRKMVSQNYYMWPDGIIPWKFSTGKRQFKNKTSEERVRKAIQHWEERTCLRFVSLNGDTRNKNFSHYVEIGSGSGCASPVGFQWMRAQPIYLNEKYCMRIGTIVHELGHTIGFFHEHARIDRQSYIKIHPSNVNDKYRSNFEKAFYSTNSTMYDLSSDMHYGPKYFSVNGENTITAKDPDLQFLMGRRDGLTFLDSKSANIAYRCHERCNENITCENGGFLLENCTCFCPDGLTGTTCNKITYSSDCGGIVELGPGETTVITSPDYPNPPSPTICFWLIKAQVNNLIKLELSIDLSSDSANRICLHWLGVRYNHVGQEGPRYCGETSQPINISSATNYLSMKLNTEYPVISQQRGFVAIVTSTGEIDGNHYCKFEENEKCPFYPDRSTDMKLQVINGLNGGNSGKNGQSFLIVKPSEFSKDDVAILKSANVKAGNWCFCFEFYLPVKETGNFMVWLTGAEKDTRERMIWVNNKYHTRLETNCLKLYHHNTFKVSIKVNLSLNSIVALSNLSLTKDQDCRGSSEVNSLSNLSKGNLWSCDFEHGLCGLHQCRIHPKMTWNRMSSFPMFGPKHGHRSSKYEEENWFLVRNGWFKPRGSEACVVTPDIQLGEDSNCLNFYFYAWGYSTGTVSVEVINQNNEATKIWGFHKLGLQHLPWKLTQVPLKISGTIKLQFKTKITYWWGSYAIDDIEITNTAC